LKFISDVIFYQAEPTESEFNRFFVKFIHNLYTVIR